MEIGDLIFWIFIFFLLGGGNLISFIFGKLTSDSSSGSQSTYGTPEIGPFEAKLDVTRLDPEDSSSHIVWGIEVKGLFPIFEKKNIGFIISVFDRNNEDESLEPVLCTLEEFQEETSIVFQCARTIGEIDPGIGLTDWYRAGAIFPELLQAPYSGQRNLVIIVRMVDADNPPSILHGFHDKDDPGILWQTALTKIYTFVVKGYHEASEHREEARVLRHKNGNGSGDV